jgi:SOS-response transcriptional repressor LexA/DNA-binding XRE family transcriptional regulator
MVVKKQKSFGGSPPWALKVAALRRKLGLTQAAFGERLQYSAMAVSRWERGSHEPVAACYIRMGNLAGTPDCWFFWQSAGLAVSDVVRRLPRAAETLLPQPLNIVAAGVQKKHIIEKAPDLIALPVVAVEPKDAFGASSLFEDAVVVSMVAAPRQWCPNPDQSRCLEVKGSSMSPLIRDGDIVAIDMSETDVARLKDKIVVVSHSSRGLILATLRRFRGVYVLEPENREHDSFPLEKDRTWRVLGKVLWRLSKAP